MKDCEVGYMTTTCGEIRPGSDMDCGNCALMENEGQYRYKTLREFLWKQNGNWLIYFFNLFKNDTWTNSSACLNKTINIAAIEAERKRRDAL